MNRQQRVGFRLASVTALAFLLMACAPLKYEEVLQIARTSGSVQKLSQNIVKSAATGRMVSLPGEDFYLVGNRKVVSSARFSRVMQESCEQSYHGTLVDTSGQFPLTRRITREQLGELAGRDGSILSYLEKSISRTLNSAVSEHRRRLRDEVVRREKTSPLYAHASVACTDYINGVLKIYFVADSLSLNATEDSDVVYWAVGGTRTFDAEIDKEIRRALTTANRRLWQEKETMVALEGSSDGEPSIAVYMEGDDQFRHIFHVTLTYHNDADGFVRIYPADWKYFLSSGGLAYQPQLTRNGISVQGQCSAEDQEVRVHAQGQCTINFSYEIEHFQFSSDMMRIEVAGQRIQLVPLSQYALRNR